MDDDYEQVYSGDLHWYDPDEPLYIACCDCGLVHKVKMGKGYRNKKEAIWWRFWERRHMTKKRRQELKIKVVKKK